MKVLSYSVSNKCLIGLEVEEGLINFSRAWEAYCLLETGQVHIKFDTITEMIENDLFSGETFRKVYQFLTNHDLLDRFLEKREIRFEAPIYRPTKILALARNYRAHAEELGNEPVEEPIIFSKTINAMLPHQGNIIYPKGVTRVDHEIELGVVIGRKIKDVPVSDAEAGIAGYTIVNDVTARDLQKADLSKGWPWLRSKNFDTFLPIGPCIVPAEFIKNPGGLELILKVNGKERQHSNTSFMINSIPRVISYISGLMTLLPGDIICTGTPEGVSPINVGDLIEASIEGVGTLINRVVRS